jgi:hypothetical protein
MLQEETWKDSAVDDTVVYNGKPENISTNGITYSCLSTLFVSLMQQNLSEAELRD